MSVGREVIVEIERVRVIRKRARTKLLYCLECGSEADFVSLSESSKLFEVSETVLKGFLDANDCHCQRNTCGQIYICVGSLLTSMQTINSNSQIKLIENKK